MLHTFRGGRLVFILVVVIVVLWPAAYAGAFTAVHGPSAQEAWPPVPALALGDRSAIIAG